jgi:hypothetical protein
MAIQRTYWDDNPEDRNFADDFWSWLKDQPQDAWLLWARTANWDNAEGIFRNMVDDPCCDRALAAWIFWHASNGERIDPADAGLVGTILRNLARGHYARSELYLDRYELVHPVQSRLKQLAAGGTTGTVPHALYGPFEGRKAKLPDAYDAATEADLAELFDYLNGELPRSEADHWDKQKRGGNLWIADVFALPSLSGLTPATLARLDETRLAEQLYGLQREYEFARDRRHARTQRQGHQAATDGDATLLEHLFYGERYAATAAQHDRCWRRFNILFALTALAMILAWRLGAPPALGTGAAGALLALVVLFQGYGKMGPARRIVGWWVLVFAAAMGLAMLFRFLDKV